ncbi:MAG: T9SS type A sorting domain-containing protein [Flavobacteriales bacterium]|nr:T9SS type A sorting domain-containing protein [Flavobacteriales bacterium]MCB9168219.1 T9SS type A sorting domain-containing protein [Flavobacteriales bacterium]
MKTLRPFGVLAVVVLMGATLDVAAQCTNTSQYPSNSIIPDQFGALTTISGCSFELEYSVITNINAGAAYQFTLSSGGYITVHQDTYNGPVIGQGYSPVTVTAATSGDLFAHWTVDANCNTATNCETTTVQLFLNCTPPSAGYVITDDCNNGVFTIDVTVTDLGDGAYVDLNYNSNFGSSGSQTNLGLGTYTIGPFPIGDGVDVVVAHPSDPACNITWNQLVSTGVCPVTVQCGGAEINDTYCYGNNDSHAWWWQSSGIEPLAILFSSGMIESSSFDHLTIYDGPNAQSPILYDHVGGTEDLAGLLVISTGPDLYMAMSSDGSVSCASNSSWEWNWTVGCLDCTVPEAEFTLVPDCIHREYSIQVDVTSTGDAATVDLVDIYHADTTFGLGVGQHLIGPFPVDTAASVGVYNGDNSLCRMFSPELVQLADSCVIADCGPLPYTYCYTNDDDAWFVYQSTGGQPVTISFNAGSLLVNDKIVVYNGFDDYAAVLFNGNLGGNLTGFAISSSNVDNAIALRVLSDANGSCQGGQAQDEMYWDVGCGLVGIDEAGGQGFHLYPNPTTGTLYIDLPQGRVMDLSVRVYDVSGRVVLGQDLPQAVGRRSIDLSGLQNGNYFIQLVTPEWVKTRQVQVAR